jgi:hypothetical protein
LIANDLTLWANRANHSGSLPAGLAIRVHLCFRALERLAKA